MPGSREERDRQDYLILKGRLGGYRAAAANARGRAETADDETERKVWTEKAEHWEAQARVVWGLLRQRGR